MKIVVLGAGRFVASRLVNALLVSGHVGQTRITDITATDVEPPALRPTPVYVCWEATSPTLIM